MDIVEERRNRQDIIEVFKMYRGYSSDIVGSGGLQEPCIGWGLDTPIGRSNIEGEGHAPTCPLTPGHELCKNSQMDQDAIGLWTWVHRKKHVLHGSTLANVTDTSMCGDDATLCEITLTTCFFLLSMLLFHWTSLGLNKVAVANHIVFYSLCLHAINPRCNVAY